MQVTLTKAWGHPSCQEQAKNIHGQCYLTYNCAPSDMIAVDANGERIANIPLLNGYRIKDAMHVGSRYYDAGFVRLDDETVAVDLDALQAWIDRPVDVSDIRPVYVTEREDAHGNVYSVIE